MTKDEFWRIVRASMEDCEEDEYQDECLERLLRSLSASEVFEFQRHFHRYRETANRGELWAAGMLLNGGRASDDGFEYFRNWLIACGEAVYSRVLREPESLAELEVDTDEEGRPDAEFEELGYVAFNAYEALTGGKSLYDEFPAAGAADEPRWDWREFNSESWLKSHLPQSLGEIRPI
ncbi:MAG: hypothetical protein AMJ69_06945 [Gammaproteobacteria bacterium SG8_47]|nr:MAG: hypothetical protein AMJ69_06945 [Gammaproteobacteria bacterium SG8_47]